MGSESTAPDAPSVEVNGDDADVTIEAPAEESAPESADGDSSDGGEATSAPE